MLYGLREVIGKQILGVTVKTVGEQHKVFIAFTDNTYIELYSNSGIAATHACDPGGKETIRKYIPSAAIIFEEFKETFQDCCPPDETASV